MVRPSIQFRHAVTGAVLAVLLGTRASALTPQETKPAHCCFKNIRYSGVCQVDPGEGESCASILSYLNNPMSVGKTYCTNTNVRGGWKKTKCAS
jgi:hypothetical protein